MVWVLVDTDGAVKQVLWNRKTAQVGLEGVGVAVRYLAEDKDGTKGGDELRLTWKGEVLLPEKETDQEAKELRSELD